MAFRINGNKKFPIMITIDGIYRYFSESSRECLFKLYEGSYVRKVLDIEIIRIPRRGIFTYVNYEALGTIKKRTNRDYIKFILPVGGERIVRIDDMLLCKNVLMTKRTRRNGDVLFPIKLIKGE